MAKKVSLILLSVIVVAGACVGVYFYQQGADDIVPTETYETSATEEVYLDVDTGDSDYIIPATEASQDKTPSDDDTDFVPSDDNVSDNTADIVTTKFTIERVYDLDLQQEVQPRVVFGTGYKDSDNYIKFDNGGNFEMYLSGYLSKTTFGTYELYDDYIFVEFENGTAAEYDIVYDDSGVVSYIIVDYAEYEIFFS